MGQNRGCNCFGEFWILFGNENISEGYGAFFLHGSILLNGGCFHMYRPE